MADEPEAVPDAGEAASPRTRTRAMPRRVFLLASAGMMAAAACILAVILFSIPGKGATPQTGLVYLPVAYDGDITISGSSGVRAPIAASITPIGTMYMVEVDADSGTTVSIVEGAVDVMPLNSTFRVVRMEAGTQRIISADGQDIIAGPGFRPQSRKRP